MNEEEMRIRCLELAARVIEVVDSNEQLFAVADDIIKYVKQDKYPTENSLTFSKISKERE